MDERQELVIILADAEQEAVAALNGIMQKYNLPCFLMEPIIDKLHRQIIDGRANELVAAKVRAQAREGAET